MLRTKIVDNARLEIELKAELLPFAVPIVPHGAIILAGLSHLPLTELNLKLFGHEASLTLTWLMH
jgi:hypothetical protein